MPSSGHGVLTAPRDYVNDIYFNPFAESSQTSFTSAFKAKDTRVETRVGFRRRGSESAAQRWRTDHDPMEGEGGRAHARASTLDGGSASGSGARHPLSSAGPSNAGERTGRTALPDTRPRLKRMMSDLDAETSRSPRGSEESLPSSSRAQAQAVKETTVIVHEVAPKDSLAGVALKYGISMADLRRANQLWTSDPIHLRKVLYIPLDKSQKAKHLVLSQLEKASESGSPELVDVPAGNDEDDRTLASSAASTLTIRRIPVSQLHFFPPSSSSHLASSRPDPAARTLPRTPRSYARDPIPFARTSSTSSIYSEASSSLPPSSAFATALQSHLQPSTPSARTQIPSLTSLLNALPLPLPLPRLSFDSGASTPTQASDEQDHELVDVGSYTKTNGEVRQEHGFRPLQYDLGTVKSRHKDRSAKLTEVELATRSSPPNLRSSRSFGGDLRPPSRIPPKQRATAAYVTPERNRLVPEAVRTAQLQPSPSMQLPSKSRRDQDTEW